MRKVQRHGLLMFGLLALISLPLFAFDNISVRFGFKNEPFYGALEKVERLFSIRFTYDPGIIKSGKTINLPVKQRTLAETLSDFSSETGLQFMTIGNVVGIKGGESRSNNNSQISKQLTEFPVIVKGRVTDTGNQPVSGASVTIKDGNRGTYTDEDGRFTINANTGDILVISFVGFRNTEVTVANDSTLNITLESGEQQMEQVVVTALGIRKEKRKIAYATQEVKGADMEKAREANVVSNLTGKVAGLSIRNKSTLFENPEINLRGGSTMVVIDGVPTRTDFWNLNSDDIESINILKGTSATALYGSLGINGAIMITTKKGKAGANGVEVTFNSSTQFQAGSLRIPETQTQYGMGWNGQYAYKDGRGGGIYDDYGYVFGPKLNQPDASTQSGFVEIPQYNSPVDPVTGELVPLPWITRGQNNLKSFLRNEMMTTNNVSLAGKSDRSDYRISLTHLYQLGQIPNTHLNSTTVSVAGSVKVTDKLKAEANVSYNKQYTPNYPSTGYGPNNYFYNLLLWMGPEVNVNDMRNYWKPGRESLEQLTYNYTWYNNPWFLAHEYLKGYTNDVVVAQANLSYEFSDELSFFVRSGATVNHVVSDIRTPYSFINYGTDKAPFGNYSANRNNNLRIVTDALLTYKKDIGNNFNANVSVGASNRFDQSDLLTSNTVGGLSVPNNYNLANSRDPIQSVNSLSEKAVNSIYGYAEISYKDMIYLNLTGRNDWTTALQKPHNSFFYPSASIGIIASEMIKLPELISFVKLRGSWADISSDVNAYSTLTTYNRGIRWNGIPSLYLPGSLIAPDLRPNQTISQEFGTEMRFLQNRIGIDFTYYTYTDKNFVREIPVSQSSGYNTKRINGDVYNRKGIELILSASPVRSADLRWDITFNYSRHRNYVDEYFGGDSMRNGVKTGGRTDVYRGWAWQKSPDGEIVYYNGLPQYINQQVNLGYTEPDWEFGVLNSIGYKNFTLAFSFDGRIGGKMFNGVEAKLFEGGMHTTTANQFRDDAYAGIDSYLGNGVVVASGEVQYDVQGNIINDTRKFEPNTTKVNYIDWLFASYTNGIDEAVLYDRSFVKLREVVLTYNINSQLLKKLPIKSASISLVGRNLLLFTDVPFMDPDGYTGTTLAEPTYRNIGFNLNLKF